MIGSEILFNSKCNLYNYMYNIIPNLFGRENIIFSCEDKDSILYKNKNCSYNNYLKTLEENPHLFKKELGLMENEINENINEIISIRSKCYSIQRISDINIKIDNNHHLRKSKGISKNYRNIYHNHEYFKRYYLIILK